MNLTKEQKYTVSRWLIFCWSCFGAGVAIWVSLLHANFPEMFPFDPQSAVMTILGIGFSAIFVVGLFLGSRSIGEPLNFKNFFNLVFKFPGWVPWVAIAFSGLYESI